MWIRPETINHDSSNKKIVDSSLIYYITTSKYFSFEVHLKGKSLYYCLRPNKKLSGKVKIFNLKYLLNY